MVKFIPFIDTSVNAKWDDWAHYPNGRPNPLYSAEAIEWKVDRLVLGFITLSAGGKACWAAQDSMPLNWSLPLSKDIAPHGLETVVSFGGASNPDISSSFSVKELEDTYNEVVQMYGAKGLDFDLENGLYDVEKICKAVIEVKKKHKNLEISFTLPTMPAGLTGVGISIISAAKNHGIDFSVNGMAMDYYDAEADEDMGKAAINAAKSIKTQLSKLYPSLSDNELYAKVAITPMIGLNDDVNGMFKLKDADALTEFGELNGLSFLSMWSFNRDNPSDYAYVDLTTSSNPEQRFSGEYCSRFVVNKS
jgi:chitinase